MEKIDFKKELKHLYNPSAKEVVVVDVPEMNFIMVDGKGAPKSKEFQSAVEALYGVAFGIKFALKFSKTGPEYSVPPLEGLWWMEGEFDPKTPDKWLWTAMIMQPDHVTQAHVASAIKKAGEKKPNPNLSKIRLEKFHEGLAAEIMHVGPYSEVGRTIEKIHQFAKESGYEIRGKHHEIYLSDPGRVSPEKLKTVLRHPIKKR